MPARREEWDDGEGGAQRLGCGVVQVRTMPRPKRGVARCLIRPCCWASGRRVSCAPSPQALSRAVGFSNFPGRSAGSCSRVSGSVACAERVILRVWRQRPGRKRRASPQRAAGAAALFRARDRRGRQNGGRAVGRRARGPARGPLSPSRQRARVVGQAMRLRVFWAARAPARGCACVRQGRRAIPWQLEGAR
eukprot:212-Lingulodinium_polyedra.AAC.2